MNAITQFVEPQPVTVISAEIDLQISTAKRYPRSVETFRKSALAMATLNEGVAQQCLYALPRDGKTIEGPSARLGEILVAAWGNCRAAARIVAEEREFVVAQGVFLDLETNAATTKEVRRRIVDKYGKRYSLDMVGTTGNAASSIALRNAILGGIPRALWWDIYDASRRVVIGDIKTLAERRHNAIEAFKPYGIVEAQICAAIGIPGRNDIGPDQLVILAGWLNAIKEGESDPSEIFQPVPKAKPVVVGATDAKLGEFAKNDDAGKPAGTGDSPTSSPAPAPSDEEDQQMQRRARIAAIKETLGLARSAKAINQIERNNHAFIVTMEREFSEGHAELIEAFALARAPLSETQAEAAK